MTKLEALKAFNLYKSGQHAYTKVVTSITLRGEAGGTLPNLIAAAAYVLDGEQIKLDGVPTNNGVPMIFFHFIANTESGKKARKASIAGTMLDTMLLEDLAGFTGREDRLIEFNKQAMHSTNVTERVKPAVAPKKAASVAAQAPAISSKVA